MAHTILSKIKNLFLLSAIVFFAGMLIPGRNVQAATAGVYTLATGKQYTQYDVTGDGKADKVKLTATGLSWDYNAPPSTLKIKVNGKTAYTLKTTIGVYEFDVKLLTLSNGKAYLFLDAAADADMYHVTYILQYKKSSGKFKIVYDIQNLFQKYNPYVIAESQSVSGKKIVIRLNFMNYTLGGVYCDLTFKYESGSLTQKASMSISKIVSNRTNSGRTLTANKSMTAYKTATLKSKSFTITAGTKVTVSAFSYKNGKLAIKVQANGKTGWIAAATSYSSTQPFKEVYYAG